MTIQELHDYLDKFIKEHPGCKDKSIMVKNLNDEYSWEEVTFVSDTVVDSCPEYGSPLYFHSKSQEEVEKEYYERNKDEDEYCEFL